MAGRNQSYIGCTFSRATGCVGRGRKNGPVTGPGSGAQEESEGDRDPSFKKGRQRGVGHTPTSPGECDGAAEKGPKEGPRADREVGPAQPLEPEPPNPARDQVSCLV